MTGFGFVVQSLSPSSEAAHAGVLTETCCVVHLKLKKTIISGSRMKLGNYSELKRCHPKF